MWSKFRAKQAKSISGNRKERRRRLFWANRQIEQIIKLIKDEAKNEKMKNSTKT